VRSAWLQVERPDHGFFGGDISLLAKQIRKGSAANAAGHALEELAAVQFDVS
jgi:hypothetical protein